MCNNIDAITLAFVYENIVRDNARTCSAELASVLRQYCDSRINTLNLRQKNHNRFASQYFFEFAGSLKRVYRPMVDYYIHK